MIWKFWKKLRTDSGDFEETRSRQENLFKIYANFREIFGQYWDMLMKLGKASRNSGKTFGLFTRLGKFVRFSRKFRWILKYYEQYSRSELF